MKHIISILLLFSSLCMGQLEFKYPQDWIVEPAPAQLPHGIISLIKVSSPDNAIHVAVTEIDPVTSKTKADKSVSDLLKGMSKGGYQHLRTEETTFNDLPAQHLIGEVHVPDNADLVFPFQSYVMFTNKATVVIGICTDNQNSNEQIIKEVSGMLTIPYSPITFAQAEDTPIKAETDITDSPGYSVAYYAGSYGAMGITIWGIVNIVRRNQKSKQSNSSRN